MIRPAHPHLITAIPGTDTDWARTASRTTTRTTGGAR